MTNKNSLKRPRFIRGFFHLNFIVLGMTSFFSGPGLSSETPSVKLLGHNLSNTSHVLDKGDCTVGLLHAGCGVTEKLTVGSSPWMASSYKMTTLALRYQFHTSDFMNESFQVSYMKTYGKRTYDMEALWLMYVRTKKLAPHFRLHYNFHANYYFNELAPFSLRRPYMDANPLQLNTSALFEVDLYKGWFIQGELGLLDLINSPIHTHAGVSLGWKWSRGYVYFGFSQTSTFKALFSPQDRGDYGYYLITNESNGYESELAADSVENDYSIHSEVTVQFFF